MSDRDEKWIHNTAHDITELLPEVQLSEEQALRLCNFLHDIEVDGRTNGLRPEEAVMVELLMIKGYQPEIAHILGRELLALDLAGLTAPAMATSKLLSVTRGTLRKYQEGGRMTPAAAHMQGTLQRNPIFWLPKVLYARAWRRRHPHRGGYGAKNLPDGL